MFPFALSTFLSAFLLFQIQPMIGKFILPWFGGTPAVWTTVMLFFQVLLTGGYGYAYWLMGRAKNSRQSLIHILLIAASILLLAVLGCFWVSPITPPASMKPLNVSFPVLHIFKLLIVSVGLPYFILASNGPLMQAWFSNIFPKQSYARLYALSNLGSLLGLLAYPVLIEPNLTLKQQGLAWSAGFAIFGLLAIWIAVQNRKAAPENPQVSEAAPAPTPPSRALKSLWIILSATASLLLLSITSQISQEVAVIPFLWILPLALYLLTFILTFSGSGYSRKAFLVLFALSVALFLFTLINKDKMSIFLQVFSYCLLLFSSCMLCHGELYHLRPDASHLTAFYLMISIGGASGGIFTTLIAPLIFNGYWEFFAAFALALALFLTVLRPKRLENHPAWVRAMLSVFLMVTVAFTFLDKYLGELFSKRNFYGVVRVNEVVLPESNEPVFQMIHGITIHGVQFIKPELRNRPTSYFVEGSGVSQALTNYPRTEKGLKVGVLGLGVGTLGVYGKSGDQFRYYEINSIVVDLAEGQGGYFTYLKDSKATRSMILGDARISLEHELKENGSQNFDILILDAFSSDSVPMHLLTQEAFDLYLKHLKPGGLIAANISNRHINLEPVFWRLTQQNQLQMIHVNHQGSPMGGRPSDWLLIANDSELLKKLVPGDRRKTFENYSTNVRLWTDDYSNLFQILK